LQIGTYSIGLAAKALNKPFYVLCESYKFVRFYPLNQSDLPAEVKVSEPGKSS
jgi:translation initiation factor eIF-2B subunit alpha